VFNCDYHYKQHHSIPQAILTTIILASMGNALANDGVTAPKLVGAVLVPTLM
jgi:hypothetical protein